MSLARLAGTEFPVDLGVTIWRDGDSVMIGGILRDASDRRSLAEARLVNEAQSRFLANMSHEIRTPLNVLGMAQVLERGELSEGQRSLVGVIKDSAEGLNKLLSDILESARLEAGETVVNNDAFDLGELITKVAALHQRAAMAKGLRFSWTEVPAETWVVGDPVKIGQIISNLLSNAVKFTQSGDVRLSAEHQADRWRFMVSDTGAGFSENQHQQIFLRFHQADASSTRRHGGSGLGLSISRQLARAMGGEVSASSQPGVGSTFCFSLLLPADRPTPCLIEEAPGELVGIN